MSDLTPDAIRQLFEADRQAVASADDVEALRIKYLGRKGVMRQATDAMKQAPKEEKPALGKGLNQLKGEITQAIESMKATVGEAAPKAAGPMFDVTLPGRRPAVGSVHLVHQTIETIGGIFRRMGFEIVSGPEVEEAWYNFDALNTPPEHPAREETDNFYFHDGRVLRSQTSPVQVRHMQKHKPPVRMIAPGRVYRPETVDATHGFMFHQIEGLAVDENITFADLKHVLNEFAQEYFGPETKTRFRPHFFPFTEPSAELDVSCTLCGAAGCPACAGKGWIELLGCGMVDPNVFEAVGYDPERYTGFAFGIGVERLAMQGHGVRDIRLFTENDARFLEQFV